MSPRGQQLNVFFLLSRPVFPSLPALCESQDFNYREGRTFTIVWKAHQAFFFFWTFKILGFSILAIKWIPKEFLANPCLGDTRQTHIHTHTQNHNIDSGWSNQQAVLTVEIIDSRNSEIFCSKARCFLGFFLCWAGEKQGKQLLMVTRELASVVVLWLPHP